jgi:hypothetical protein
MRELFFDREDFELRNMTHWYHLSGDAKWTTANVESYAAYGGEEEPRSFDVGSVRMEVLDIADRWSLAEHRYFRVKPRNRALCLLRYNTATHGWEMSSLTPHR